MHLYSQLACQTSDACRALYEVHFEDIAVVTDKVSSYCIFFIREEDFHIKYNLNFSEYPSSLFMLQSFLIRKNGVGSILEILPKHFCVKTFRCV
jgi:hypothetical protein